MEPTWGDLPTFAQDPKESTVKERLERRSFLEHRRLSIRLKQVGQVRLKLGRQHQWRELALRHFAVLQEKGSYLRLPRIMATKKNAI